jgi:hypothetical protein
LDYRIVTGSTDETVIAINFGKGGSDEYQLIAAKNVFYLWRLINGVSENLTSVAFTRRRGEWQRLGVVVANQVIRGYVDSTMLLERRDASFSGGTIGLSIGSFAPRDDVVVEIDNVEFRRPGDAVR